MNFKYLYGIACFFMAIIVMGQPKLAYAGSTIADSPCDPQYYESLENRAWLEAQREITQNQNLIFKPDSVLSYTCFNKYLDVLGAQATNMFSETTRWGSDILPDLQDHMNKALEQLVLTSLKSYLEANFHGSTKKYLGGRASTERDDPGTDVPDGSYSCDVMDKVWKEAKCYDFQKEAQDGFFTFKDYAEGTQEWRKYPVACSEPTSMYTSSMTAAGINADSGGTNAAPWQFDATKTYYEYFDPAQCGSKPAIPTGVQVFLNDDTPYDEKVCIQPGCHYVPSGGCQP